MHVSYTATFTARCPVDDQMRDSYEVTVETNRMIKVEELLAVLKAYHDKTLFQEEVTAGIAIRFDCKVTTTGFHSDVKTVCVVDARSGELEPL